MFLHQPERPEGVPTSSERPIDLVHLVRQTLGDRSLEREILQLFSVQARTILAHLGVAETGRSRMELAHTLKGSARAVGAWRVADRAERCELACEARDDQWRAALVKLTASVDEAIGAINDLRPAA